MTHTPLLFTKRFGYGLIIFSGIISMILSCTMPFSSKSPNPGLGISFDEAKTGFDVLNICVQLVGNQQSRSKYLMATAFFWSVIFYCLLLGWPQLTLQRGNRLAVYLFCVPITVLMALADTITANDTRREALKILGYRLYGGDFQVASSRMCFCVEEALFGNSFLIWTGVVNIVLGLLLALPITFLYTIPEDYQGFWKFLKWFKPYKLQQDK